MKIIIKIKKKPKPKQRSRTSNLLLSKLNELEHKFLCHII